MRKVWAEKQWKIPHLSFFFLPHRDFLSNELELAAMEDLLLLWPQSIRSMNFYQNYLPWEGKVPPTLLVHSQSFDYLHPHARGSNNYWSSSINLIRLPYPICIPLGSLHILLWMSVQVRTLDWFPSENNTHHSHKHLIFCWVFPVSEKIIDNLRQFSLIGR